MFNIFVTGTSKVMFFYDHEMSIGYIFVSSQAFHKLMSY